MQYNTLGKTGLKVSRLGFGGSSLGSVFKEIDAGEGIPALRRVQAAGKARFVGITGLPIKLYQQVMDQVDVDQIQSYCHYCLNDTALLDLLPYLQKKNIAIFNAAPLAMRLLTDEGPPG